MRKKKTLLILLAVLLAVSLAAFAASRYEERQEQISESGETVLAISADSVTALQWRNQSGTFAFTKDGGWRYDDDPDFPVDDEKIDALLNQFEDVSAAFVIEDAADDAQYGLDAPAATIIFTAAETEYILELGDVSKMDGQRYATLGDGRVYLLTHDPLEEFDAVLGDVIRHDTVPQLGNVQTITFSGAQDYRVVYDSERGSICADDVYFADSLALDTGRVGDYLDVIEGLSLTDYVSYSATAAELAACGLDEPELSVTIVYLDDEEETQTLTLYVGRDQEELQEAENTGDFDDVTACVRLEGSNIVYRVDSADYTALMACARADLRHQKLFTADFDQVTAITVTLDGQHHSFAYTSADEEDEDSEAVWLYQDAEVDGGDIGTALRAIRASSFTADSATGRQEISLTVSLANEAYPSVTMTFYRCDGENCLAVVDGESVALVPRTQVVDLIEAVNAVILAA